MLKRLIRASIRRMLGVPRLRRLVEAELDAPNATPKGHSGSRRSAEGRTFTDRHGVSHHIDPGLRDRIAPNWRAMVSPATRLVQRGPQELAARRREAANAARTANESVAALAGRSIVGRVLEVGCHDGAVAFQLARQPNTSVVASDVVEYYVTQQPNVSGGPDLERERAVLDALRKQTATAAGVDRGVVQFVEDDVSQSRLADESFDVILSFEVLEHVLDVRQALRSMARLLVPGGIAYHEYNPFFSINGGHSLCTLDLPWGHVRFDATDVTRYLQELRPDEAEQAQRFYEFNLNRVTIDALRRAALDADLEVVALLPFADRSLLTQLSPHVLADARRNYPDAGIEDLISPLVTIVLRKPGESLVSRDPAS